MVFSEYMKEAILVRNPMNVISVVKPLLITLIFKDITPTAERAHKLQLDWEATLKGVDSWGPLRAHLY